MKLIYDGVDLAQLGTLRILSHTTAREPAEAPQRERVTYKVRLDFFEQNFRDNYALIEQLRLALKKQQADLLWQDDSGSTYLERTVCAAEDEALEETGLKGGTYWQAVVFHFWFYNHDVVTQSLSATVAGLDLGAVEHWEERLDVTRWDELRSARKLVQGSLQASGRLQADTTLPLAQRQASLLAAKDALMAALGGSPAVAIQFGTFNQTVKITSFRPEVNQPNNYIAWTLTAIYTIYPDETNYAWLDLKIARRENHEEGVPRLILSGRIGAPSLDAATTRLNLFKTSIVPTGWQILVDETTEPRYISESDSGGDGTIFVELGFSTEYRDTSSKACTYQRSGAGTPVLNLGTVDKFRDGYTAELFSDLRSNRKRAGGTVTIGGKWFAADSLTDVQKVSALMATKAAWDTQLVKGSSGTLSYAAGSGTGPAPVFNQVVRVLDFSAQVDRLKYFIDWSLTASWTRFPNESDYALCELRVTDTQDRTEGTVMKTLSGRIGAPTPEAARAKLVRLRQALIPAGGYVLRTDSGEENRVETESDTNGGANPNANTGDPQTFIELSVNETWQKALANILSWRLRILPELDPRSAWIRTTYSGTVTASGITADASQAAAAAQAAVLGDNKLPFKVRTSVSQTSFLVQTDQQVIVTVDFSYEYQSKATGTDQQVYLEATGELAADTFGSSTETVSGFVVAPTLAMAQSAYLADVRNTTAYQGLLLLNERSVTLSEHALLDSALDTLAVGDDRFTFSFQVFRPKSGSQTAISYSMEGSTNYQVMEKVTAVNGTVWAIDQTTANALVDTLIGGLSLGKRVRSRRSPRIQQGPAVSGGSQPVTAFIALEFTEEYVDLATGISGLLETECEEDVVYPIARVVVKPIPDGIPIVQQPGTTDGRRSVTARAVATTETAARAWVLSMRTALLTGSGVTGQQYELPPQVKTSFRFLPQTVGVPRSNGTSGPAVNTKVVEVSGSFSEVLLVATM